jgi:hypothetical protein
MPSDSIHLCTGGTGVVGLDDLSAASGVCRVTRNEWQPGPVAPAAGIRSRLLVIRLHANPRNVQVLGRRAVSAGGSLKTQAIKLHRRARLNP